MSDDTQARIRRSIYIYRIIVAILMLSVLGVWAAVGMQAMTATVALIVTGVCGVSWIILAVITKSVEKSSGLRPEGGVKWDGNIGGTDDI